MLKGCSRRAAISSNARVNRRVTELIAVLQRLNMQFYHADGSLPNELGGCPFGPCTSLTNVAQKRRCFQVGFKTDVLYDSQGRAARSCERRCVIASR